MNSLVIELQKDILNEDISIVKLLRKSYVLAEKLNLTEYLEWILLEIKGYDIPEKIPSYRTVDGILKSYNPYHGWQTMVIKDNKINEIVSKSTIKQKISEIELLVNQTEGQLIIPKRNFNTTTEIAFFVDKSRLYGIIESVKQILLEWVIEMEKKGVLGEELIFSEKEKANEHMITINLNGNQNSMQIQQNADNSTQTLSQNTFDTSKANEIIKLLELHSGEIDFEEKNQKLINSEIEKVKSELNSSKPQKTIVKTSFSKIKNILEGISGSIVASGIIHHLDLFK